MRVLEEQITICHGDRKPREKTGEAGAEPLAGPQPRLLQLANLDLIVCEVPTQGPYGEW